MFNKVCPLRDALMKNYEIIKYRLFIPGGNMTALVGGLEPDAAIRREVQDYIMRKHPDVEQVGFVGEDSDNPELIMTGGEFCGNAARSAAWYYLDGKPGDITIRVSGVKEPIRAGVDGAAGAWADMPVTGCRLTNMGGIHKVEMESIIHYIISVEKSAEYLRDISGNDGAGRLLNRARELLQFLSAAGGADMSGAAGVIFTECVGGVIKIHPCVFVPSAGTSVYETACGSGSAAVAMVEGVHSGKDASFAVMQPSGMTIAASAAVSRGCVTAARICGPVVETHFCV
jgi:diaminopimelate epimerase